MTDEPDTAELKAAWQRAKLWRVGLTFRQALDAPPVFRAMRAAALAYRESRAKPAQGRLFEGVA